MGATSESSGVQLIEATRRRVHWVGWLANAVGSLLVLCSIGFLIPILAADEDMAEIALLNVPFMAVYFFLAGGRDLAAERPAHQRGVRLARRGAAARTSASVT